MGSKNKQIKRDDFGDRMKEHENKYRVYLPKKHYYILRLDGRAFSKYTKNLKAGAEFGYTQSDEISILFSDLQRMESEPWFGGNVQKIVSIASALATSKFNQLRRERGQIWMVENAKYLTDDEILTEQTQLFQLAQFDARVFAIKERHEALNTILWRQQDCTRNSVQMLARDNFSHKQCDRKNCNELKQMLIDVDKPWESMSTVKKYGTACYRRMEVVDSNLITGDKIRMKWFMDTEIPSSFSDDWTWFDEKVV
jgi:tRNA(His) guanylyltransferase